MTAKTRKGRIVNETGNKYGKLTVLHRAPKPESYKSKGAWWACQCECGNTKDVKGAQLRKGEILSCGCYNPRLKDETGNVYGMLTVLELDREHKPRGYGFWLCQCECGNQKVISGSHLRQGQSRSCGCYKYNQLKGDDSAKHAVYSQYKSAAKRRGYAFNLSRFEFVEFLEKDCFYCGASPSMTHDNGYQYNGIDRMNNTIGYIPENCASCCRDCNIAKHTMSVKEFTTWACRVAKHSGC